MSRTRAGRWQLWTCGAVLVLAACGGKARRHPGGGTDMPAEAGGAGANDTPDAGATLDAGDEADAGDMPEAGPPQPGCPPVVPGNQVLPANAEIPDCSATAPEPSETECPSLELDFDVRVHAPVCGGSGVAVEALQLPEYTDDTYPTLQCPRVKSDPKTWDRAALPAGACVLRLHGVKASCYPNGGKLLLGACGSFTAPIGPASFYEAGLCNVAPGCTTSAPDPYPADGYWWYLAEDGTDTDLVICAPQCANTFSYGGAACLTLNPTRESGCP